MEIFDHPDQLPNDCNYYIFWVEDTIKDVNGHPEEVYTPIYNRNTSELKEESKTILLFRSPFLGSITDWKANQSYCEWYLNKYFERVFSLSLYNTSIDIEFDAIIIPEKTLIKINGIIKEYNLEPFEDFIIYFISFIHKLWMELNIYRYEEKPESLVELKKTEREIPVLISLLKDAEALSTNIKNTIFKVNFIYPANNYSFESETMKNFILEAIIEKAKGSEGDWRTGLIQNFFQFDYKILKAKNFKYLIVQAIHNFLNEQTTLKPSTGKRTNDRQIRCIIEILEAVPIYIRDRQGELNIIDSDKLDIIRNWIKKDIKNQKDVTISLLKG